MHTILRCYLVTALLYCGCFTPLSSYAQSANADDAQGITYTYYDGGDWSSLAEAEADHEFDYRNINSIGTLSNFSLSPAENQAGYGFYYTTYLEVVANGAYTFYLNSSDGSRLYIDGQLVVDNDGRHAVREESGQVTLNTGRHLLEIEHFNATGTGQIEVSYAGLGISKQLIPDEVLFLNDVSTSTTTVCGRVNLSRQSDVDACDCTSARSLTIYAIPRGEDAITNLSSLSSLTAVANDLDFFYVNSEQVSSLDGLNNLVSIGGDFELEECELTNFQGLEKLETIEGEFELWRSQIGNFEGLNSLSDIGENFDIRGSSLDSFRGLERLNKIDGSIQISFSTTTGKFDVIENFEGLSNLTSVGGISVIDSEIGSFKGLENLEEITGSIAVTSATDLQPLVSLEKIGTIGIGRGTYFSPLLPRLRVISNNLTIQGTLLEDLSTLDFSSLERVGSLTLAQNPNLTSCCAVLDLIDKVEGEVSITNNGLSCSSLAQIETACNDGDSAVTANAGADRTTTVGGDEPIILRGRASGPNPFRRYQWEKVSGPDARLENASTANLRVFGLQAGVYIFRFTATDSKGNSGSDETTLTVAGDDGGQPDEPVVTVTANAGPDRTISVGVSEPFILRGRASGPNPFRRYQWEKVSGPGRSARESQHRQPSRVWPTSRCLHLPLYGYRQQR